MRVSYFGHEGSFAHEIAQKAYPNAVAFLPGLTIKGVLDTLYRHKADCGVVPIENSSGGIITDSIDALISPKFIRSKNRIQEELILPIHLNLMSNIPLRQIRTVYSHPIPLSFLALWLRRHLPHARQVSTGSTAEGALFAKRDSCGAAIATQLAANLYGLKILSVQLPQQPNQTSFYSIARKPIQRGPAERMAICFGLPNRPGSLVKLLTVFGNQNINLTRITSRPLLKRNRRFSPHEYVFWVDFEGNPASNHIQTALREARHAVAFLDIIGAYCRRKLA